MSMVLGTRSSSSTSTATVHPSSPSRSMPETASICLPTRAATCSFAVSSSSRTSTSAAFPLDPEPDDLVHQLGFHHPRLFLGDLPVGPRRLQLGQRSLGRRRL